MASKYVNDLRVLSELLTARGFTYSGDTAKECAERMDQLENTVEYQRKVIYDLGGDVER